VADSVEGLVERARGGDAAALDELVRSIKNDVFNLAVRMLWHPADAEDATQEILIKVITSLAGFRGESSLRTWVFRIASNHLLTTRRRRAERPELTFTAFGDDLGEGLDTAYEARIDERLLEEEVKIGCTQGMLLCLDREHRLAYILGEVFELSSEQAATVLGTTPAAYRKRLSRARERIQSFMRGHCGLVDPANQCRCHRRVGRAIELGRIDQGQLLFAGRQRGVARRGVAEMERLQDAAAVFRSHPDYKAPEQLSQRLAELVGSGGHPLLIDEHDAP
jgi:RNA polymerase sigma factor (sigma-70 family)